MKLLLFLAISYLACAIIYFTTVLLLKWVIIGAVIYLLYRYLTQHPEIQEKIVRRIK